MDSENDKEYPQKSYKLFTLWLIIFICAMVGSAYISSSLELSRNISIKISLTVCMLCLLLLMFIILKSERVYFINGVSYKEAKEAGSERRIKYAREHLKLFLRAAVIWFVYALISLFLKLPLLLDTGFFLIDTAYHAIASVKIRL